MTRAHVLAMAAILAIVAFVLPAATTATTATSLTDAAFGITGLDLHDGMMLKSGGTYYLYGTEYGCGFTWQQTNTPWCGFGVSTSTDATHWTAPTLLFSPNDTDTWTNTTWTSECGATGAGCFNPRMIQRTGWCADDGVWILWFNAPADYNRTGANAYYVMGCNGPAGPCGAGAGRRDLSATAQLHQSRHRNVALATIPSLDLSLGQARVAAWLSRSGMVLAGWPLM